MAPKGQSFEVPMRESKQLTSSKVSDRQRKRSLKKVPGKKTEEKPTEEEELDFFNRLSRFCQQVLETSAKFEVILKKS